MEKEFKYDVLCTGMALIDSIIKGFDPKPVSASGYRASSCTLNAGGEAVNESVTAAKLGLSTAILCALGDDSAANMITDVLKSAGVDTSLIVRPQGHSTPVTTMFVNEDGTRKSVTCKAHTMGFRPQDNKDALCSSRALILGSLFRSPFDDPETILETVKIASENGVIVVADTKIPNFRMLTLGDVQQALQYIDYITPNEDEARYFTGKTEPSEMAQVFLNYGAKNVLVKLGSKGCYFKNADTQIRLPAIPVDAVDSTGAGDNFIAGFVSELLRGQSLEDALRFATACGAICTTAVGACTALKDRTQVLDLLNK
ncbi:MAG: carbohydrate kinase family protein [Spirochaetales bacterium]|nr:carbohydrate kinase family protein [Spirochaetales bacterium]